MKAKLIASSFICAAGAIALAISGCDRKSAANMQMPQRPPPMVSTVQAISRDVPIYIEEIGKTAAAESVTIQPQVGGKVMEIHFTDGADVKKGDLLYVIDPRPYQAALQQAEATLAQNHANVDWTRSELKRVQGLVGTGAVSTQEVESKQNAVAVAEAQIRAGEANVQTAKLNLDYCTIRSPIDGRAGQHQVDIGNVVTTGGSDGGAKMLVIQRLNPIFVDFTIPEQRFPEVRDHAKAGNLKTLVWLPQEAQAQPREGELTFLDNMIQPGAGTIKLRATLKNPDAYFWPGQFVNVRLVLEMKKGAVLVPVAAEQIGQQGPYVYVVRHDSTAELRPVTPGQRQGDLLVIDKGLSAGEPVIVEGQMSVTPEGKVTIAPSAPPTSAPAAVAEGAAKS